VVNDIAPEVPYAAITRLTQYIGKDPKFDSIESLETYLRETLAPFGPMTDATWQHMAYHSSRKTEEGYRLSFDPQIVQNFRRYWMFMHVTLWRYWDRIQCPVLILRGVESDFLSSTLADKMLRRLPNAELIEFEGVGHVPSLTSDEQIEPVVEWLSRKTS
jgi:pimeloyl-ACP methyl ester carboxylesterase